MKHVTLIISTARSGSSLFFSILKRLPGTYAPCGECTPYYRLHQVFSEDLSSDMISDKILRHAVGNTELARDLLNDFTIEENSAASFHDASGIEHFTDRLILRLSLQWPSAHFSSTKMRKIITPIIESHAENYSCFHAKDFFVELLRKFKDIYPEINPWYYDLPEDFLKSNFPNIPIPSGPPHPRLVIEEPPFILLTPGRSISPLDLSKKTLLLKSTINCYRMNLIRALFPSAIIKVIYLTRNPASTINGLINGWLHRGFFSHNLEDIKGNTILRIRGYSEHIEQAKHWWNFELPPGWKDYIKKPIEEVCTFQWYRGSETILNYLETSGVDFCRIQYENIVCQESRTRELQKTLQFLNIEERIPDFLINNELPIIQSTEKPEPFRWKKREQLIMPLLARDKMKRMVEKTGYNLDQTEEWI